MNTYRNGQYDGFNASEEILSAIEKLGGDDILNDDSNSHRIWADPTESERELVVARAWELADCNADSLIWSDKIVREVW